MKIATLSSGSNANATVVVGPGGAVLIDCGLSGRECERRLVGALGIDPGEVRGIVITHEHRDHVLGVGSFSKRNKVPVFCNRGAIDWIPRSHTRELFETGEPFTLAGLTIESFPIPHDAREPVGFRITEGAGGQAPIVFTIATDIGCITRDVEDAIVGAHGVLVESNHDLSLLAACRYPDALKARILSHRGHLSNLAAGELIARVMRRNGELGGAAGARAPHLHLAILGHLSIESNTPERAYDTVTRAVARSSQESHLSPPHIAIASRSTPSPLIDLRTLSQSQNHDTPAPLHKAYTHAAWASGI